MKFIIIALLALSACTKPAQSSVNVGNDFKVDKLFTVDGCSVYRFSDGRDVYFTNCNGSAQWNETCGKNCTRNVGVD